MEWLLGVLIAGMVFVFIAAAGILALIGLFSGAMWLLDRWTREDCIRKMKEMPTGEIFTARGRGAEEAFRKIVPVFEAWENPAEGALPVKTGRELAEQVRASKKILAEKHIIRRVRFRDVRLTQQENGANTRKWNDGGKEWEACALTAAVLKTYTDSSGNDLVPPCYFSSANIVFTRSRRLKPGEEVSRKDQWGRKITVKRDFYRESELKNCPSCGFLLPQDLKDIVCPSCGSTIFADYYDWQVESIEIEPETTLGGILAPFRGRKPGQGVIYRRKKLRKKIVRFSENDFRGDVMAQALAESRPGCLIDLSLGGLEITSVRNTEDKTFLRIVVPVYKTEIDENGKFTSSAEKMKAEFVRARYPERFNHKNAVISAEKRCPGCGGPCAPDEKGSCPYCGTFLFKDSLKWKKA